VTAFLQGLAEAGASWLRLTLLVLAAMVLLGALSHAVGWLVSRQGTARFIWSAWNVLGSVCLAAGVALMGYGWLAFGLETTLGSLLAGVGLLLASAGLWMLVPV
jgi:hypothetical protein